MRKRKLRPIPKSQIAKEMDRIREIWGAQNTEPDMEKTRKILSKCSSLQDELREMRDDET